MSASHTRRQRGTSLIEVLVTLLVSTFGLLGLAAFVTRSTTLSVDATQRARAVSLLQDMHQRIGNNKARADDYVTGKTYGAAAADCSALAEGADKDLCEWGNALNGTQDKGSSSAAAALGLLGCVEKPDAAQPIYVITIAFGTMTAGVPPATDCAKGSFDTADTLRRSISARLRVATLSS